MCVCVCVEGGGGGGGVLCLWPEDLDEAAGLQVLLVQRVSQLLDILKGTVDQSRPLLIRTLQISTLP